MGLSACGGARSEPEAGASAADDPCFDADIAAKRVWNDETRVELKGQVMQWSGELGADVAQQKLVEITNSMDRLTDDWARMRKAVCGDHFKRKTLDAAGYQKRVDCLDRLLSRQRTLLGSLSAPNADVSAQLSGLNEELGTCH